MYLDVSVTLIVPIGTECVHSIFSGFLEDITAPGEFLAQLLGSLP